MRFIHADTTIQFIFMNMLPFVYPSRLFSLLTIANNAAENILIHVSWRVGYVYLGADCLVEGDMAWLYVPTQISSLTVISMYGGREVTGLCE